MKPTYECTCCYEQVKKLIPYKNEMVCEECANALKDIDTRHNYWENEQNKYFNEEDE